MRRATKALDQLRSEGINPGEISGLFIEKLGGKQAFVDSLVKEYQAAHVGSMARAKILGFIVDDAKVANASGLSLDDLDDEALEEVAGNIERKMADARQQEAGQNRPAKSGRPQFDVIPVPAGPEVKSTQVAPQADPAALSAQDPPQPADSVDRAEPGAGGEPVRGTGADAAGHGDAAAGAGAPAETVS